MSNFESTKKERPKRSLKMKKNSPTPQSEDRSRGCGPDYDSHSCNLQKTVFQVTVDCRSALRQVRRVVGLLVSRNRRQGDRTPARGRSKMNRHWMSSKKRKAPCDHRVLAWLLFSPPHKARIASDFARESTFASFCSAIAIQSSPSSCPLPKLDIGCLIL